VEGSERETSLSKFDLADSADRGQVSDLHCVLLPTASCKTALVGHLPLEHSFLSKSVGRAILRSVI
jgi:hypothetical protein